MADEQKSSLRIGRVTAQRLQLLRFLTGARSAEEVVNAALDQYEREVRS